MAENGSVYIFGKFCLIDYLKKKQFSFKQNKYISIRKI